ncbi:MAG: hypothetical protein PHO83_03870 [Geobacteraceae bacterium]|nr:hypothetical protein [Geobacteraceae bacterium]
MPLIDLTKSKVKDDSGKLTDPDDYAAAVTEALKRYSRTRPRLVCEDLDGDGSHDLALPAGWVDGLSAFQSIEFPIGEVPESLLDTDEWGLYRTPTATTLRLVDVTPDVGESVRVLYNAAHTEDTAPTDDLEAIANLAASICLLQLATAFGQTGDPIIAADVVNYRSKADKFQRLASALEGQYNHHLGIGDDAPVAAAMAVAKPKDDGRVRLTHR